MISAIITLFTLSMASCAFLVNYPRGLQPGQACRYYGYDDVIASTANITNLYNTLLASGYKSAYLAAYNGDFSGSVLTNTGAILPYTGSPRPQAVFCTGPYKKKLGEATATEESFGAASRLGDFFLEAPPPMQLTMDGAALAALAAPAQYRTDSFTPLEARLQVEYPVSEGVLPSVRAPLNGAYEEAAPAGSYLTRATRPTTPPAALLLRGSDLDQFGAAQSLREDSALTAAAKKLLSGARQLRSTPKKLKATRGAMYPEEFKAYTTFAAAPPASGVEEESLDVAEEILRAAPLGREVPKSALRETTVSPPASALEDFDFLQAPASAASVSRRLGLTRY